MSQKQFDRKTAAKFDPNQAFASETNGALNCPVLAFLFITFIAGEQRWLAEQRETPRRRPE
jgi:hypothetical protein